MRASAILFSICLPALSCLPSACRQEPLATAGESQAAFEREQKNSGPKYEFPKPELRFPNPAPPAQHQPFTAPACALPDEVKKAFDDLFDTGMADPRGLELRAVHVRLGDEQTGDAGVHMIPGWVFEPPAEAAAKTQAIALNGLVYPVEELGPPVDLKEFLAALFNHDDRFLKEVGNHPIMEWTDQQSASHDLLLSSRAALFYRAGDCQTAETLWTRWSSHILPRFRERATLILKADFFWALAARGYSAHMRGDDANALRYLTQLVAAVGHSEYNQAPFLTGSLLHAQQSHWARSGGAPRSVALEKGRQAYAGQAEWIAALIKELPNVQVPGRDLSGYVDFSQNPLCRAILAEGAAAVEPLLKVLAKKYSLSRTITNEDQPYIRRVYFTRDIAYDLLVRIFDHDGFPPLPPWNSMEKGTDAQYRKQARRMRAWWKRYGKLDPAQRKLRALGEDLPLSDHLFKPRLLNGGT